ncbi:hypothetical protein MNBD_GAMMA18-438 [hydrothermal vent metagenome]|uniref:STAS domain-containing protein n=1 Tax=hydrothermal vent metagenome TaxID=652676 RepID=A0A3B0Z905_9ZZZZ
MAAIEAQADGVLKVSGELTFSSVSALLAESLSYFKSQDELQIDLAGVAHSDTAGVALLVEWMRMAKQRDAPLFFSNIPEQMWAIIDVSDLGKRLPLLNQNEPLSGNQGL